MSGQYTDGQLAEDIAATGKNAPRVTPERIDQVVAEERYWQPEGTTLTVCVLTLINGFTVVGHSASASADNFDEEIGRKLAKDKARSEIWALEGYLLRQHLHDQETHPLITMQGPDFGDGDTGDDTQG